MIIDCHGHYTTAPAALQGFRDAQLARLKDPALPVPADPEISESAHKPASADAARAQTRSFSIEPS
jgi:hypothetical protein